MPKAVTPQGKIVSVNGKAKKKFNLSSKASQRRIRDVVMLKMVAKGWTHSEISTVLDMSSVWVKRRYKQVCENLEESGAKKGGLVDKNFVWPQREDRSISACKQEVPCFCAELKEIGFTAIDIAAAFKVNETTSRRWLKKLQ